MRKLRWYIVVEGPPYEGYGLPLITFSSTLPEKEIVERFLNEGFVFNGSDLNSHLNSHLVLEEIEAPMNQPRLSVLVKKLEDEGHRKVAEATRKKLLNRLKKKGWF